MLFRVARKDDPRLDLLLGRVALERGLIDGTQLREALTERALSVSRGRKVPRPLGAIFAARKHLTDAQVLDLTRELEGRIAVEEEGRRKDAFLGQILVDADLVAPGHLEECLFDQAERWKEGEDPLPRLGDLLVMKGYATREDVAQALALQRSLIQVCAACQRECSDGGDKCPVCGGAFKPRMDSQVMALPPPPPPVVEPAPERDALGRYKLRATLRRTDGGTLYEAQDVELDRRVALRVLDDNKPELLERARAAASIKHPNLAPIFEAGLLEGRPFVASERADGRSLGELRTSLKLRQIARALKDVALALHHAHENGLVHRGLSPESVRIDGQGRALLVDLWAPIEEKPAYLSPERARGDREIGPAADVWSLGALLYEALAGAPPFDGESREAILAKVMCEAPAPPTSGRTVNRPLETLCLSALEKKASRRPESAKAFAEELAAWLKGEAREPAPKAKAAPDRRKLILIAAAGALAVVALLAGLALSGESPTEKTLRKAGAYLAAEQPDAALKLYQAVLEREPSNDRALSGRDAAKARIDERAARAELEEIRAELQRVRAGVERDKLEERLRRAEARARD